MRDSVKLGIASMVFSVIGMALNLASKHVEKNETEEDKEYFNEVATRIERGMK